MENIAERIKKIRKGLDLSQQEFAENLKLSQGVISGIENGHRNVSRNVLEALGIKYNINASWVLTGVGEMHLPQKISSFESATQTMNNVQDALLSIKENLPDTEELPEPEYSNAFDVFKMKRGIGVMFEAKETDDDALVMLPVYTQTAAAGRGQPENQLQEIDKYIPIVLEMLGGANPANCGIVRVVGDSMTDMNLFNGDFVIFDRTQVEGDGVYVISIGNDVRVKHLEYRPIERKIVISSENAKRYPNPEIITYEQAENLLRIHGKVISWLHRNPY